MLSQVSLSDVLSRPFPDSRVSSMADWNHNGLPSVGHPMAPGSSSHSSLGRMAAQEPSASALGISNYGTMSNIFNSDPFDDAATNTRMGRCNQAAHQIPPTPPPQFHESVPYSSAMQPRGGVPMPRTQPPMFHAQPNTQPQPASTPSMQQQVARHQRVLLFLRHCAKCTDPSRCSYGSKCQIGKQLWSHIFHCSNPHCTYRNCVYSRELLRHYQKCVDKNCPICGPVRAYVANDRGSNGAPLCPF